MSAPHRFIEIEQVVEENGKTLLVCVNVDHVIQFHELVDDDVPQIKTRIQVNSGSDVEAIDITMTYAEFKDQLFRTSTF